jgi:hypothetical protein
MALDETCWNNEEVHLCTPDDALVVWNI